MKTDDQICLMYDICTILKRLAQRNVLSRVMREGIQIQLSAVLPVLEEKITKTLELDKNYLQELTIRKCTQKEAGHVISRLLTTIAPFTGIQYNDLNFRWNLYSSCLCDSFSGEETEKINDHFQDILKHIDDYEVAAKTQLLLNDLQQYILCKESVSYDYLLDQIGQIVGCYINS